MLAQTGTPALAVTSSSYSSATGKATFVVTYVTGAGITGRVDYSINSGAYTGTATIIANPSAGNATITVPINAALQGTTPSFVFTLKNSSTSATLATAGGGTQVFGNPGFDTDTVWTKGTDFGGGGHVNIVGGVVDCANAATIVGQSALTSGTTYAISVDYNKTTSSVSNLRLNNSNVSGGTVVKIFALPATGSGTLTFSFTATGPWLFIEADAAVYGGTIDNFTATSGAAITLAIPYGSSAIAYDTRWGTATDANGWITFGLPGGCRRVWADSSRADDTGDGLSAATAKKTLGAANTVFKAAWTVGDQIMVAGGTAGGSYASTVENFIFYGGSSPSLMTVMQSYDRADPTGATTPYGQLVGAAMPVIAMATNDLFSIFNVDGKGYLAVKGIELKDTTTRLAASSLGTNWQTNNHPGMVYQNCRLNGFGLSLANSTLTSNAGLISKCSQWNSSGVYTDQSDGFSVQDFVSAHCGWDITATRDDPVSLGGPTVFAHAFYLHAGQTNVKLNRIVMVDATDGLGSRCGASSVNQLVSIDNPFGINAGGFSGSYLEQPLGLTWQLDDAVIMGSDKQIDPDGHPGGVGAQWINSVSGSYYRNVALFDYDGFGTNIGNNLYSSSSRINAAQVPNYMLFDKWSAWNFAKTGESDSGVDLTNLHTSWSNSILDVVPTGFNGTVTTTTARVSAPAGYKTRAQTYAAMGYTTKADLVNAMLWRPDLPWAQALCGIGMPAMGLTPLYTTVAAPTVVTGAPVVYPTALVNLTASSLTFTRGTPKAIVLSGVAAGSYLSLTSPPAGFTNTPFRLTTSGTATSGSNQITGVGSTTGILKGMLIEMKSDAYTTVSLFPAMTVVTNVVGSTITVSANATANSSGQSVFVSAGGRLISYDGSGTGAATPTLSVLETAKDTAMGTRTTAFTLSIS